MYKLFIIFVICGILFNGCLEYSGVVGDATVLELTVVKEHTEWQIQYMPFNGIGIPTGVRDYKYMPVDVPNKYYVIYQGKNKAGELLIEKRNISYDLWLRLKVGSHITIDG